MSNKTALQELKSQLEKELNSIPRRSTDFEDGQEFAFNHILDMLDDKLLEKERRQIMEAFENGKYGFGTSMEIYYEAKYGNPQGDPETKQ